MERSDRRLSVIVRDHLESPEGDRIEQVVAHRARERPDTPAVRQAGRTLTYRELVKRATPYADALTAAGVGASDVVAVQLPKSLDLVCLILGILRAGAIYTLMPLDWPVERRQEVLRQTKARLCVSHDDKALGAAVPVIEPGLLAGGAVPDVAPTSDRSDLGDLSSACCVFFTSGSTGKPKCTVAPHAGILRTVFDPSLEFGSHTVMLQAHSCAWDAFPFELWTPLLQGGTAVLGGDELFSYDDVRAAVVDGVNTLFLAPSMFNSAITDDPECLRGLRSVVLGGERVSGKHVEQFFDRYPDSSVFNIYGPAEATICVTVHKMASTDDLGGEVPVGKTIQATGVHLLDEARVVVPVGDIGEIAVSGAGVALGYLGDTRETEARFTQLPVGPHGELTRVYLTGDFGRFDKDGRLWFHGRRDRQVKVLGIRVEPGEVERVAGNVPGVSAVATVPLPIGSDTPDGLGLVYVVDEAGGPAPDEVRAAVSAALPATFVPRLVRQVDAISRNTNGKVDLADLARLVAETDDGQPVPGEQSPLATVLAELEVLIGVVPAADADVLDLGLRSISALKLIRKINAQHGVSVPMRVIFRSRTPAAIAQWIEANAPAASN